MIDSEQMCPTWFRFKLSTDMNSVFRTFLGVAWGGLNRSYKTLVHACSTTKCNAHDKGYEKQGDLP